MAAVRYENVPFFVPELPIPEDVLHIPGMRFTHAAVWGDAAVLVPAALYEATGDQKILAAQYNSMVAWVEGVHKLAGDSQVWDEGFQFGDWLDPAAPPEDPPAGATDTALVATAYYARSARLLARAAELLDRSDDAKRFAAMADAVEHAFLGRFLDPDTGALTNDTQTAHALGLHV